MRKEIKFDYVKPDRNNFENVDENKNFIFKTILKYFKDKLVPKKPLVDRFLRHSAAMNYDDYINSSTFYPDYGAFSFKLKSDNILKDFEF